VQRRSLKGHQVNFTACVWQSDQEVKAWKKLCGTLFACEADARQALSAFEQGLQATFLHSSTVRATPRYGKRGRPGQGAHPDQVVYHIEGALTSSLTARPALIDQHSCFILATNELDDTQLPPHELLESYKGQGHAELGFRFLKDPQFLVVSLDSVDEYAQAISENARCTLLMYDT